MQCNVCSYFNKAAGIRSIIPKKDKENAQSSNREKFKFDLIIYSAVVTEQTV